MTWPSIAWSWPRYVRVRVRIRVRVRVRVRRTPGRKACTWIHTECYRT